MIRIPVLALILALSTGFFCGVARADVELSEFKRSLSADAEVYSAQTARAPEHYDSLLRGALDEIRQLERSREYAACARGILAGVWIRRTEACGWAARELESVRIRSALAAADEVYLQALFGSSVSFDSYFNRPPARFQLAKEVHLTLYQGYMDWAGSVDVRGIPGEVDALERACRDSARNPGRRSVGLRCHVRALKAVFEARRDRFLATHEEGRKILVDAQAAALRKIADYVDYQDSVVSCEVSKGSEVVRSCRFSWRSYSGVADHCVLQATSGGDGKWTQAIAIYDGPSETVDVRFIEQPSYREAGRALLWPASPDPLLRESVLEGDERVRCSVSAP